MYRIILNAHKLSNSRKECQIEGKNLEGDELASAEKDALIVGACNNVLPKLVAEDMSVFTSLLEDTFPGSEVAKMEDDEARTEIIEQFNSEALKFLRARRYELN